jgi:hydrogenase nickel incorporation protein HypA/HybF
MHEQSIVEALLALAIEKAQASGAARIHRIHLVVGDLSGVVDESVEFYFGFLSRDTIAAQARLAFRHVPAQLRCRDCDNTFVPEKMNLRCPGCGQQRVEIVAGRELYLDSLEVE